MADIILRALGALRSRIDSDRTDKLSYQFTTSLLLVSALLTSADQFVFGQPIQCFLPAEFTTAMEQFVENYCWVQNTYFVPYSSDIPASTQKRSQKEVAYYQWVPHILLLCAILFYLPWGVWKLLSNCSGINFGSVERVIKDSEMGNGSTEKNYSKRIAKGLSEYLQPLLEKGYPKYLLNMYLLIKLLFLTNALGQMCLLQKLLSHKVHVENATTNNTNTLLKRFYGFELLQQMKNGSSWASSGFFPRVTLCDVTVRVLGNIHTYTIECVLTINMFYEKIFILLWFLYFIVALFTLLNIFHWMYIMFCKNHLFCTWIKPLFSPAGCEASQVQNLQFIFLHNYLRRDGIFLLHMLQHYFDVGIVSMLVEFLWKDFCERQEQNVFPQSFETQLSRPPTILEGLRRRHWLLPIKPDLNQLEATVV